MKSARVKRRVISDSEDGRFSLKPTLIDLKLIDDLEAYEESAKETIPPLRKKVARTVTATKSCGSNSRDRPLALGAEGDKQVKAVATKRGIAKPVGSTIRKAPAGLPSSTKTGAAKISKSTRSTSTARPPSEGEEGEEDEDGGNDAAAAAKPIRVTASKAVNVNKQLVKASRISGSGSEAPAARPSLKRKRSTLEQDCPDTVTSEPAGLQPLRGRVVIANTSTDRASAQSKFDDDASAPMPRGTGTVEARSSHPARVTGPDRFKPTDYGTTSKKLADRANLRNIIKSKAVTLNLGASEMTAPTPAARKAARKPINLPVEPNPYTPGKVFKPSRGPQHEYPAPPPDGGLRPPIRRGVHVHGRTPPTLVGNWFDGRAGLRNFN